MDQIPFRGNYLEEQPSKRKSIQRARVKLTWSKVLWNVRRVDVVFSAFPSRCAAAVLSALLLQTQLLYSSQLVFNLKFIKPRKGGWKLQSISYCCCDNFNLKSNLKSRQCFVCIFISIPFFFFNSAPLWRQSSDNVAAALLLCFFDDSWTTAGEELKAGWPLWDPGNT